MSRLIKKEFNCRILGDIVPEAQRVVGVRKHGESACRVVSVPALRNIMGELLWDAHLRVKT